MDGPLASASSEQVESAGARGGDGMGMDRDMDREAKLANTFVELADTLVADYEVGEFLQHLVDRCADLVGAAAVGVMLVDEGQELRLAAASTQDMHDLELFEIQRQEGPCYEAYASGEQIRQDDIEEARSRWPGFTPIALEHGYRAVRGFPLRVRAEKLGALNVFFDHAGPFTDADVLALQALADVAAIGILQERSMQEATDIAGHLQTALDSRVVIERAVGRIVERTGAEPQAAFEAIRSHARSSNELLRVVAQGIVDGTLAPERVKGSSGSER